MWDVVDHRSYASNLFWPSNHGLGVRYFQKMTHPKFLHKPALSESPSLGNDVPVSCLKTYRNLEMDKAKRQPSEDAKRVDHAGNIGPLIKCSHVAFFLKVSTIHPLKKTLSYK